jgi:hypothetical protein
MVPLEIESDDLTFEYSVFGNSRCFDCLDKLRILMRDPFKPTRECMDGPIAVDMNLNPLAIVFVLHDHVAAYVRTPFVQVCSSRG